jgi:hypothetical protein
MKYIVGENVSFVTNGRLYKPGDEIDSDSFKFKETLEKAISSGKLKPVQDTTTGGGDTTAGGDTGGGDTTTGGDTGGGDTTTGGDTAGGDTAGGDTTTGGDTGGGDTTAGGDTAGGDTAGGDTAGGDNTPITPKKRKAMEKAAINNGLENQEEIKNLSDKDLAELLADAGVVA